MNNTIILGGGCFWCVESVYKRLSGVESIVSGYANGDALNPSYQQICSGNTGHAEVVKITYNPDLISIQIILDIFFTIHDPTTLSQQGNDIGTQYRSIIIYDNEKDKIEAEEKIKELTTENIWPNPIITEIEPLKVFYKAEEYHQDYFNRNPTNGYCQAVIPPKLLKLENKLVTSGLKSLLV